MCGTSRSQPDADNLLGTSTHNRPAPSEGEENGMIYAFSDPTGRYRQIELHFAADTGLLRAVFVYPWRMTWADCRSLDVLADSAGNVISLGLY